MIENSLEVFVILMNALNVYVLFENINQLISKQYLQFFFYNL